jgi:hypothetical protein
VLSLILARFGEPGLSHPNRLEAMGHKAIRPGPGQASGGSATGGGGGGRRASPAADNGVSDGAPPPPFPAARCACASRPVCAVVTVNRVQDVYATPVYPTPNGQGASVDELEVGH